MLNLLRRKKRELDGFQAALDKIEKIVPMTGSFKRIDPYIVEHDQFGHHFKFVIFHQETANWYDNHNPDWSFKRLRDHSWMKKGDVVFDLGCNAGFNTIWYAMEVGANGHVHAFDPYPWNTAAVRFNSELNGLANVTTHSVAISDRSGTLPISITDARILNGAKTPTFDAPIRSITQYSGLNPTFMKIDIEGAELETSRANFSLFPELRSIYLEFHDPFIRERGLDPSQCLENFQRHGFDIRLHEPNGERYDLRKEGQVTSQLYLSKLP